VGNLFTKLGHLARNRELRSAFVQWRRARFSSVPVCQLSDGVAVSVAPKFNDFWAVVRQHPGEDECRLFESLLPRGGVTFDVGANIGLYTVLVAKRSQARVIAFEPMHRYCAAWHQNVELNGVRNATLFQCAVSDSAGLSDFTCDLTKPLNNRFVTASAASDGDLRTRVSTITLDQAIACLGVERVDLLKIDVEGAEPKVLRGAAQALKDHRITNIYMEFIIEFMEEMGEDPKAVYDQLRDLGYAIHAINPDGTIGAALSKDQAIDDRRVRPTDPERDFHGLNVIARFAGDQPSTHA
jgi:FkbM family methyltransferase